MDLIHNFYIFSTAAFSALVMVPYLRRWAIDMGKLDEPDERKVHQEAVPRIGGIAIFLAFLFSTIVYADMGREVRGVMGGALIIFFTGLIDDLYGLSPKQKFSGQIAGALVTVAVGSLHISSLGDLLGFGPIELPLWLAIPFTVFAVVGVINAINFIDGLDGLAGGLAAIATIAFFLLALRDNNPAAMAICAALLGGVLGFLRYNSFPARIFMGDTGSLTVGFVLAFLAVLLTQRQGSQISPITPLIILGLPIVDTLWVMSQRVLKKKSPFYPDKTHVHHKFLDLGFNHRFTVITIYGISFFWTLWALLVDGIAEYLQLGYYLLGSLIFFVLLRYLSKHRQRFPFLRMDSEIGLRSSNLYLRISHGCHIIVPILRGIILLSFALFLYSCNEAAPTIQWTSRILFVAGIAFLTLARNTSHGLLQILFFVVALPATFFAEHQLDHVIIGMFPAAEIINGLLISAAILTALKILFRKPDELYLTLQTVFLALGLSVSLAIASPEVSLSYRLPGVLWKVIVLFLAFRVTIRPSPTPTSYLNEKGAEKIPAPAE